MTWKLVRIWYNFFINMLACASCVYITHWFWNYEDPEASVYGVLISLMACFGTLRGISDDLKDFIDYYNEKNRNKTTVID